MVPQISIQLAHVVSCSWWKADPPSPFQQPQLAIWASCALVCGTRISLFNPTFLSRVLQT